MNDAFGFWRILKFKKIPIVIVFYTESVNCNMFLPILSILNSFFLFYCIIKHFSQNINMHYPVFIPKKFNWQTCHLDKGFLSKRNC